MNVIKMSKLTKARYLSSVLSLMIIISSIGIIFSNGFNWGLDFTGGVVTEVRLDSHIKATELSELLAQHSEQEVSVISAGESGRWVLRYSQVDAKSSTDIVSVLAPLSGNVEVLNSSIVGPQIGQELGISITGCYAMCSRILKLSL